MKTSSVVTVAIGLGLARLAYVALSNQIRIAIVGCGGRGAGHANPAVMFGSDGEYALPMPGITKAY